MILDDILSCKRERLVRAKEERSVTQLAEAPLYGRPRVSLQKALERGGRRIIAEVKRASPSRGRIRQSFDPLAIAAGYERAGAAALSVLTEEDWFEGSLEHLAAIRQKVKLPLLRKDFIFDPYQVHESRAFGADAILLIAAILDDEQLGSLVKEGMEASLELLVEVHDRKELDRAVGCGASLIGINNRDLKNMTVDLNATLTLCPLVPAGKTVVAESGIKTAADIELLEAGGVRAFLVGEVLMEAPDPAERLKKLLCVR